MDFHEHCRNSVKQLGGIMRSRCRYRCALSVVVTLLSACCAFAVEPAQDAMPERQAIQTGVELEQSRQWRTAIDHYKKSVKDWPESDRLQYGLRRATFHFGIERRYSDSSFLGELRRLSPDEALALFDEISEKSRTHFVEGLSTTWFVAHGTESLWLSLANERFLETNLPDADPQAVQRLRDTLRDEFWNKRVESRQAAHHTILTVARLAQSQVALEATPVILEYVFGGCNGLDDYSSYLTPDRLSDLNSNIEGEFVGIGIVMEAEPGRGMQLVDVLPRSPAAEAGLRAGEHIVGIDGRNCRDMSTDEAAGLLTGRAGSSVQLTIEPYLHGPERRVVCARREVQVDSVTIAEVIDEDRRIGYIRMTGFQKTSAVEMDRAIEKLSRLGIQSLIWDLRGNPGGLLTAAVKVVDRFIPEGRIVSTRGRTPEQNSTYSATRIGTYNIPLVLLIDEQSASASEIVAGAIRDHRRGTIVGRKSFGKWSVQTIYPTGWGTGLRLTTAKFYSPHGQTLGKIGVEPDVHVALPKDQERAFVSSYELDLKNDLDVRAALSFLRDRSLTQR